jgi:hypothetical protein
MNRPRGPSGSTANSAWVTLGVVSTLTLATVPGVARAHQVAGSRFDAPLPLPLLFVGAGATVALTAGWLAVTERSPAPDDDRHLWMIPGPVARPVRGVAAAVFLFGVLAALGLGVVGRQVAAENFATVFTWAVWFRGVALIALLVGSPWPTLSPWRTVYRGLVRLEGDRVAVLGAYPDRLGSWPAVVGFVLLLGVVETLTVVPRSPRLTTVLVAAYALLMVAGATLYGPEWLRRADPLAVFYRLFGRVAPIVASRTDDGGWRLAVRSPWRGALAPVGNRALVVFVVATVYTVSFDGFTNTRPFQTLLFGVRRGLGTGALTSVLLYGFGLVGFVAAFVGCCRLAERLGAPERPDPWAAVRGFAPTVLPIAAAYEVAHNYPYVLGQLGRLVSVAAAPQGVGIEPVDPLAGLPLPAFWGSQVVLIVGGHVVAVVAAHYVAVKRYDTVADARRAHLPLVALMIGYTVLSLWIVSRPVVA